jgi:hypothetical protein
MEKHQRTDRTFPIFVILATIFMVVLMVVTFPRHEGRRRRTSNAICKSSGCAHRLPVRAALARPQVDDAGRGAWIGAAGVDDVLLDLLGARGR